MIITQDLFTTFYVCPRKAYLIKDQIQDLANGIEADYKEIHLVAFSDEQREENGRKTFILRRMSKNIRERHIMESSFLYFVLHLKGEDSQVNIEFLRGEKNMKPRDELISAIIDNIREVFQKGYPPSPSFGYECKGCPFYKECFSLSEREDDLSLINGIGNKRKRILIKAGFRNIDSLSNANPKEISAYVGISLNEAYAIVKQAKAIKDRKPILMKNVTLPFSEHEYFFDVEKDDEDLYLFGLLVDDTYYHFILSNEDWKEWFDFMNILLKYPNDPVYHYDKFDKDVIQKFGKISNTDLKNVLPRFIDLYSTIRGALTMPVRFYSLKDVAKNFGFEWRNKDFNGYNAMIALSKWKESKDISTMQNVLDYNEDDCRALKTLKAALVKMKKE